MIRSNVDLPHPDGPTSVISSPRFGRSTTVNVTFSIAVLAPKTFVTSLKTTSSGRLPPRASRQDLCRYGKSTRAPQRQSWSQRNASTTITTITAK